MDDNAQPHRTLAVEELLESEDIIRMDWLAYTLDLNPIEHVWDALGRHDNVCTAPIMANKDILGFVQSPKNSFDADSNNGNEMNDAGLVPTSSEMRDIMKGMRSYLGAYSNALSRVTSQVGPHIVPNDGRQRFYQVMLPLRNEFTRLSTVNRTTIDQIMINKMNRRDMVLISLDCQSL
ncbi:hypothetical protein TNCV_716101 [Trichonephila clavipes]|nr:hypothetical protein TNCV_716101 [Trichonephila clavipes]